MASQHLTHERAKSAVLNTVELLETILLQLPLEKILIIQRVCHHFHNVITTSPTLQTKLWLRFCNPETRWYTREDVSGLPGLLFPTFPRYLSLNPPLPDEMNRIEKAGEPFTATIEVTPAKANPFLKVTESGVRKHFSTSALVSYYLGSFSQVEFDLEEAKTSAMESASWMNMLVTDPPCRKARVEVRWRIETKPVETRGAFNCRMTVEGGLTLGEAFRRCLKGPADFGKWCGPDWMACVHDTAVSPVEYLEDLERGVGLPVVWETLYVDPQEVVLPSDHERALVQGGQFDVA